MMGRAEKRGRKARVPAALALVLALVFSGCAASNVSLSIDPPQGRNMPPEEKTRVAAVLGEVELRNKTVESDPGWIESSYEDFMIRNLSDIDDQEYSGFSRYLDNGAVYVIVHPAYYTFFQNTDTGNNSNADENSMNAMDRFLSDGGYSSTTKLIKAQEKMLRDFLELKSTEKKLIVIIMPKAYRTYKGYKFRHGKDEFMRFINSVTNASDSVIYMYSKKPNRGSLTERDKKKLLKFLVAVRAETVMMGGGYAGRCVEDFYKEMDEFFGEDRMFLVPEITAISPSDMTGSFASDVLHSDGTINIGRLSHNIRTNSLGTQEITPLIRNLSPVD